MAATRALVTLTMGPLYQEMARFTHPLMTRYAAKCNAQFVVIDTAKVSDQYGIPSKYEKFQIFDLFERYDRILFVDTDILIAPYTPSLFDLVPEDRFAASNEAQYSMAERDKALTQEVLGAVDWKNPYFNSGVMLLGKQHKAIFDPTLSELHRWGSGEFRKNHVNLLNDQPYLNHRLNSLGIPLFDLGSKFNHTRVIKETYTRFNSYMIHYAGPSGHRYGERIEQIGKDAKVFESKSALYLSQHFLPYRWLADRIDSAFISYLTKEKFGIRST